jgi:hypothetical protein
LPELRVEDVPMLCGSESVTPPVEAEAVT